MGERLWSLTAAEDDAMIRVDERWGELLAAVDEGAADRDMAGEPVPERFFAEAGATGLLALPLPRETGGAGLDPVAWVLTLERIGYLCRDSGFALILGIRTVIAQMLLESGRQDVIERYVVPITRGTLGIALAYSEDADAFTLRTVLRRRGDGFVLSGHKDFLTGGYHAQVFLVYARNEADDMVACLVHRDDPGVVVTRLSPVGIRTSGPTALDLREVPVARDRIVVSVDGLSHAQQLLNSRRLTVCGAPIGRARALVELSVARLNSTIRHGQPLSQLPNVQGSLGRMYIAVETARATLYRAARRVADGKADRLFDPVVSAAKHVVVNRVRYVLEEALQVLGGYFYYGDPYFGTCLRDFAGLVAFAGTQDLLEVNLGTMATTHLAPLRDDRKFSTTSRRGGHT
jgi:alkylation response protein AidB-like acyl-CoA dehydrogenase